MRVLLDTNILTRIAQPAHSMHAEAVDAVTALKTAGEELCVVPQNLIEFWAVATRPISANGLDMTSVQAEAELAHIKSLFRFLPDAPSIYDEWEALVVRHAVAGKNTHDAHITAAMNVHGITHLLTFNSGDFKRYSEITVVSPPEVTQE
jgi:predicted nucleic acid-binding protein